MECDHQSLFMARLTAGLRGRGIVLGPAPARVRVSAGSLRSRPDSGMIVVELAIGLLAIVLVLVMVLGVVTIGLAHVSALDAARAGARAAARGESDARVVSVARQSAPDARISIVGDDRTVAVTVVDNRRPFPGLPAVTITRRAVAERERPWN